MKALVCPNCGATLVITMAPVGRPYLTEERPESIECYAGDCEAEWEPNGVPRNGPRWERYPDLYSPPARAIQREARR